MFYLSILVVKEHQTVEPNAKYMCTTKPFYVTDILKPNGTEPKLSFNQVEPKRTEPGQNPIKPNLNLDPDRTKTKLLLVGLIPSTNQSPSA